ncbi:hypothetical protein SELMODRAFT_402372 [Selaginella moellendorffii]|uniref:Uncharacterized protein n=1 Tax=Selaginella moellendorffii TaxID=88036 RepID=D8QQF2_SELML|nr:hypothetical protein SELMODRAFT_402372 [Selaginella moellendorffii]
MAKDVVEEKETIHVILYGMIDNNINTEKAEIRSKSEAETRAKEAENEVSSLKTELASLRDSSAKEIRRLERNIQGMGENNEFSMSKMNAENDACRRETECVSEELSYLLVQHGELEEQAIRSSRKKLSPGTPGSALMAGYRVKAILASYDDEESFLLQQHKAASSTSVLATPEKSKKRLGKNETIKVIEKESIGTSKELQVASDRLSAVKLHDLPFHLWNANRCNYGKKLESLKERTACGLIFGEIEKLNSAVTFQAPFGLLKSLSFSIQKMDMLANDYTTSPEINRQMTTFLGFKSIPVFIANLTLELFNKGTTG